jgi:hypothetical protein
VDYTIVWKIPGWYQVQVGVGIQNDNSFFYFGLVIKTKIYLLILLPDKFGYPIIQVRVQSRPNNIVNVSNTKLEHYLVKKN